MATFVTRVLVTGLGLWVADILLQGIRFDGALALWMTALLVGLVNAFVRPLVILLTLPLTFLTLGLFLFVVNGAMLLLVAAVLPSFHVDGLGWAILAWVILALVGWLSNTFIPQTPRSQRIDT